MQEIVKNNPNLQKEIETLEKKLAEKKAELVDVDKFGQNHDLVRGVIKEHLTERFEPKLTSVPVTSSSNDDNAKVQPLIPNGKVSATQLRGMPQKEQLQVLVGVALARSIAEAVTLTEELASPYLLDELHDLLIDQFYELLVKRQKI